MADRGQGTSVEAGAAKRKTAKPGSASGTPRRGAGARTPRRGQSQDAARPAPASQTARPASPALSAGIRTLRMAAGPYAANGLGASAQRLSRRLEAASDGRIVIETSPLDGSGLDAIASGAVDLYHASENDNLRHDPGFAYFAGLPFFAGLEPHDLVAWLEAGGGQALWDRLAASFGVKSLTCGHTGRAPGFWSREPLQSLADVLRGPVATAGLAVRVIEALGGRALRVRETELRAALDQGRVHVIEHAGARISRDLGLPTVAPCHTAHGLMTAGTFLSIGISRTVWDSLAASDRALIEACCAEERCRALSEVHASEAATRADLAEAGVRFETLPSTALAGFATAADAVVAALAGESREARKIHASYMEFKRRLACAPVSGRPVVSTRGH